MKIHCCCLEVLNFTGKVLLYKNQVIKLRIVTERDINITLKKMKETEVISFVSRAHEDTLNEPPPKFLDGLDHL